MRILLKHFTRAVDWHVEPVKGGVDTCVVVMADALARRDIAVGIAETSSPYHRRRRLTSGIPVWTVEPTSYPSLGRPRSWASLTRSVWQLRRAIAEFSPDVVHLHFAANHSIAVAAAAMLPRRWKLVVTLHNSDVRVYPEAEPPLKLWQERLLARADRVTAVSQALARDATRTFSAARTVDIIPNGVSSSWSQRPSVELSVPAGHVLLYAGRLHRIKAVDLLLRAFAQLAPQHRDVSLWIAGDGPEGPALKQLASELQLGERVRWLGFQNADQLRALYRAALAVVLPSTAEGLPFTVLEANAAGAFCIAAPFDGVHEAVRDGVTGLVADSASVGSLAAALARALCFDRDTVEQFRGRARRFADEQFSEGLMIDRYIRVYSALES